MSVLTPNLTTDVTAWPGVPFTIPQWRWGSTRLAYQDGASQGYLTRNKRLRRWRLSYVNQTDTQLASLMAFIDARKGCYEKFYWDHPMTAEVDIPVFLEEESLQVTYDGPRVRQISFEIQETT